jgi:molybdate transport system substrate-binding protein
MRRRSVQLAAAALLALLVAAPAQTAPARLTVFAASSLTDAFGELDPSPRYSFGGSSMLETQIRNGAPADLFASAAPLNAQRLFRQGLVEKPVTFTSNQLTLIVPRSNPAGIASVYDLRRKPVKLVVAGESVPVGAYTRSVLRRLRLSSVLGKVVSQETDARAVAGKVALGQADAGFVYLTDARAVADRVRVIRIPASAQPRVRYQIAVVSRSSKKATARAWIRRLLSPHGQAALKEFGFFPVPSA